MGGGRGVEGTEAVLRATNGLREAKVLAASPEEAGRALLQGLIEARAPQQHHL